jgi:UDP-GlcNAc:undecaprenyl-phosphate GlcNAc-1-phosphate transferase
VNAVIALGAGLAACLLSAAAMTPLRRLALRWGLTDRPAGHRAHTGPTAFLGGVGIALATAFATAAALGVSDLRVTAILLAALAVAVLGLIDDIRPLPIATRLIVESVAAGGVVASGVQITLTGQWMDGPLTVMWVVVMTNSYKLLDTLDGALGAVTAATAVFLVGAAFVTAQPALAIPLSALAFACLGFLIHNWAPARIFMGDSGSLFIGFVLTCSAIALVSGQTPGTIYAGLLLPAFVAVVDTGVVMVSRVLAGRPPLRGGSDHVTHRLQRAGLSTRAIVVSLATAAALTGALSLTITLGWVPPLETAIVAGVTAIILIGLLQGVDVYAPARPPGELSGIGRGRR